MKAKMSYGCDSCSEENVKTACLKIGGESRAYLCAVCWPKEMEWRKERNKSLAKSSRFTIADFPKEEDASILCESCGRECLPAEWKKGLKTCEDCE